MNEIAAEQALSNLERSKKPLVELLDDALFLLGLRLTPNSLQLTGNISQSRSDSANFKGQWVLRWFIKRLTQEVDNHNAENGRSEGLLDDRTWLLLHHLLTSIPTTQLREILVERKFAELLGKCLQHLPQVESGDHGIHGLLPQDINHDLERPVKRRKLSNDVPVSSLSFLRTESQANVLLATSVAFGKHGGGIDSVPPTARWTDTTEAANKVLAQVLDYASRALDLLSLAPMHPIAMLFQTLNQWLELWTNFKPAKTTKQDARVVFNQSLLLSVLTLLQHKSRFPAQPTFATLERLVAIHTVLPMREKFQSSLKVHKIDDPGQLTQDQLRYILEDIVEPLGSAIVGLIQGEARVIHLLLSIAGRIISRADVPRRRAETLWLEALHFTLHALETCFICPDFDGTQAGLKEIYVSVFAFNSPDPSTCERLLNTFSDLAIQPSSAFWRQFAKDAITSNTRQKDVSKIVNINSTVFVTSGKENELLRVLGERADRLDKDDQDIYITSSIVPILASHGRSRQLPAFVDFWKSRLAKDMKDYDCIYPNTLDHRFIWEHPALFSAFENACLLSNHFSFFEEFLEELAGSLSATGTEVTNHATNSRIAIADPILRALTVSAQGQELLSKHAQSFCNSILAVLREKHKRIDLQWRFWKLLDTLTMSGLPHVDIGDLKKPELCWPTLDLTLDTGTGMACYHAFCLTMSLFHQSETQFQSRAQAYVLSVIELFRKPMSSAEHNKNKELNKSSATTWNGLISKMSSSWQLMSACLSRLAALPISLLLRFPRISEILLALIEMSSQGVARDISISSNNANLMSIAESIVETAGRSPEVDLFKLYLEFHATAIESTQKVILERIPRFVQKLARGTLKKHRAQKLQQAMFDISQLDTLSEQGYVECLDVLHALVSQHPSIFDGKWTAFADVMKKSTGDSDLHQFVAAGGLLEKLCSIFMTQALSQAQQGNNAYLREISKWAKKRASGIAKKKKETLFSSFWGFALPGIALVAEFVQSSTGSQHDAVTQANIIALRDSLQDNGLDAVKKHLKKSPSTIQCFMAWKTIEILQQVGAVKASDPECLDVIDKIRKQVDDLHRIELEEGSGTLTSGDLRCLASYVARSGEATGEAQAFVGSLGSSGRLSDAMTTNGETAADTKLMPESLVKLLTASSRLDPMTSHAQSYLALATFINTLDTEILRNSPAIIPGLQKLTYLDEAIDEISVPALLLRLEISKLILDKHPQIINQHVIDSILQALTLLLSSASKIASLSDQNDPEAGHIFDRLCNIMSTLLIRYRRRINGRYHLILPVLQNLLKCLFCPPSLNALNVTPATYASKAAFLESLPYWLNPRDHTSAMSLPQTSAAKFSRILQTLCDPSASSARHTLKRRSAQDKSGANLGLVDETKVLRQQVSQHMQYLLPTYCQVTLDGYLSPEVREKLLPGMFTVISATDIEILRGMNAGMTESQRAIWKDLYADWRRNGKWDRR